MKCLGPVSYTHLDKFLETKDDTKANVEPTTALIAELEKAAAAGCEKSKEVLAKKDYLGKKSVWILSLIHI